MQDSFGMRTRLLALLAAAGLIGLIYLYVKEFRVFSNTLGVAVLVVGSMLVAAAVLAILLGFWRTRFLPLDKHWLEILFIAVPTLFFAPLFGSLLNRSSTSESTRSFTFLAESAYFASGYGFLKGEKMKPTGYRLNVRDDHDEIHTFKYKTQPYYPITKPGERILLPVKKGLLGFEIVDLE